MLRSIVGRQLTRHATTALRRTMATAGGQQIAQMSLENPNLDVVRYTHKNRTWSTQHVQYYSEAVAIGLLETGLQSGDVVLSWLPEHFSEQVRCIKERIYIFRNTR